MKVAMYYNNNDVRIEEMPVPKINKNEILVKIQASGICGSDVMEWYRIKNAPRVLGHEIAGDIVKIGKDVKKFKVDDRVFVSHHVPCNTCKHCQNNQHTICDTLHSTNFYPGGFAQYLKVPEINVDRGVFVLPKEISYKEGTFIEPLACVVRGMKIAEMKPDRSALILGSGIAGLLNIKFIKAFGAKKIIATDINEYRLKIAKKNGANFVINAKKKVPELVKKYNGEKLVDLVILCTGSPQAAKQAIESVDAGGTLLFFAPTEPGIEISFPLFDIWNKQIKIFSTYAATSKDIVEAIRLIKSKKIKVKDLISHRLPMKETPRGFKLVAEAKKSMKIIIEPQK
ncbi:MAG: alcohol dehydrogenase catalytic domain-containing protein [Thermoplasmatales archaeon]|nr:MAG: alcohol dehydrogenase catalytic domain-containing protein [Thermoplasmatales archaeon]